MLTYEVSNAKAAQLYIIEMYLLFIYDGGIQKFDLEDPISGWVVVDRVTRDNELKIVAPRFILPLTDQSFIIPQEENRSGPCLKVYAAQIFNDKQADNDSFLIEKSYAPFCNSCEHMEKALLESAKFK